jgi:hypothetical protein
MIDETARRCDRIPSVIMRHDRIGSGEIVSCGFEFIRPREEAPQLYIHSRIISAQTKELRLHPLMGFGHPAGTLEYIDLFNELL